MGLAGGRLGRDILLRGGPSLTALGVFLLLLLANGMDFPLYRFILSIPDGFHMNPAFGDLGAVLQAGSCWRHGVNVYAPSACMGGGWYNYSPFLLRAALLPIGPQDRVAGGMVLDLAFIASLALLPGPESLAEMFARAAAAVSTTVIFALGQANLDAAIFVVAVLGCVLVPRGGAAAMLGYGAFMFAAALKFYPVALLALFLRESRGKLIAGGVAVLLVASGFFYVYGLGTAAAVAIIPENQPFHATFGAIDIPLGLTLVHLLPVSSGNPAVTALLPLGLGSSQHKLAELIARGFVVLALIYAGLKAPRYASALQSLAPSRAVFLLAGALVMVFCFCAVQSLYFRAIFLILTLPGIWRMRQVLLAGAVMFLLWAALARMVFAALCTSLLTPVAAGAMLIAYWLFQECVWWWVVIQFSMMIFCFFRLRLRELGKKEVVLF